MSRSASSAAVALGVLTIAGMATGILLLQAVGGYSGRDVGANAGTAALMRAMPLLVLAEVLKVLSAVCQYVVVTSRLALPRPWRMLALIAGIGGAALIAASGAVGLYAAAAEMPGLGPLASALAFAAVAATGAWALTFVSTSQMRLARWHWVVGLSFGLLSLASAVFAPLAMLVGLVSIAWWFGLARALRRAR